MITIIALLFVVGVVAFARPPVAWMLLSAQTFSVLLLLVVGNSVGAYPAQQTRSAASTTHGVAPPELRSLPTISIPEKKSSCFPFH